MRFAPDSAKWTFDDAEKTADISQSEQEEHVDPKIVAIVRTIRCMLERRIDKLDISHSEWDITVSGFVTSYHERQLVEQSVKSIACQCKKRKFVSEICVVRNGAFAARHITR